MITSALIAQCRREFGDVPRITQVARQGNGSVNQFNTGRFPVVENSYAVYTSGSVRNEGGDYSIDLDSGDITMAQTPANGLEVKATLKYANWRDKNWNEAINAAIKDLNGRGFFRQILRESFMLSAGVRVYSGPSACIDMYEVLQSVISGQYSRLPINWSYQQDANKLVLGVNPTSKTSATRSYLRNMQTYESTSAVVDVKDDWLNLVRKYAGAKFYSYMAGKIAKQGHATVEDGHFSFTNLRTQARDLYAEFENEAKQKKPSRPAKDIQFDVGLGGVA